MDALTFELLSSLISNIEDDAIRQLSITSKNMASVTNKLKDDSIFYKSRVENILGYLIDRSYTGDWKGFYYILIKFSNTEYGLNDVFHKASSNGNNLAVNVLLADKRVNPSVNTNYAIKVASNRGHTKVVKLLLADPRVDPSTNNSYPIRTASMHGRTELVKLLLANPRIDPSDENNYAIKMASGMGRTEVVKLLLADPRVDPSDNNNQAIQVASERGHIEVMKLLLGSNKIELSTKTKALKNLNSMQLSYNNYETLAKMPLKALIQIGNQKIQARDIIMTKYFWWLRLKILHNIDNVKEDPFKVALQMEGYSKSISGR